MRSLKALLTFYKLVTVHRNIPHGYFVCTIANDIFLLYNLVESNILT